LLIGRFISSEAFLSVSLLCFVSKIQDHAMTDTDKKSPREQEQKDQTPEKEKIAPTENSLSQLLSSDSVHGANATNVINEHEDFTKKTLESLDQLPTQTQRIPFTSVDAEIEALLPRDVINMERKCILMILEARMLLRELVEYKLQKDRLRSGNLSPAEIHNLLLLSLDDKDDQDFISDIQELKRQLIKEIRQNRALELDLEKLEKRIAFLIQNRTSIQEIDRELKKIKKASKKKKQPEEATDQQRVELDKDKKRLEHYSHLFYLLQTEPKYLAQL
jgi:hypothetical protein